MSTNDSVETSALAGVACNAIMYGAHLVVFPICMFLVIQRRRKNILVPWILICTIIIQFILSTIYISVQLYMTFTSFVHLQTFPSSSSPPSPSDSPAIIPEPSPTWWNTPPIPGPTMALISSVHRTFEPILASSVSGWGSPNQEWSPIAMYWLNTQAKIQILSSTVCFVNTILGDGILIWRLYNVWGNRIYCIPPIISLTASVICAALMIGIQSTSIYSIVNKLAMACWALAIGTQVIATILIAYRIWPTQEKPVEEQWGESLSDKIPYKKLLRITVESGAIYSAMALALLIFCSIRKLDAAVVLMGCIGQIAAIIPATIIIFLHFPSHELIGRARPISMIDFTPTERQNTGGDNELLAAS
ncbi:hypothetical protein BDQ17DRAFT_877326 [Cyathus striatus]|nr:hypothetical protein BDQ17DRAFT_877326 [Cyathus striatus]